MRVFRKDKEMLSLIILQSLMRDAKGSHGLALALVVPHPTFYGMSRAP